jgi:hypothetical protein
LRESIQGWPVVCGWDRFSREYFDSIFQTAGAFLFSYHNEIKIRARAPATDLDLQDYRRNWSVGDA